MILVFCLYETVIIVVGLKAWLLQSGGQQERHRSAQAQKAGRLRRQGQADLFAERRPGESSQRQAESSRRGDHSFRMGKQNKTKQI